MSVKNLIFYMVMAIILGIGMTIQLIAGNKLLAGIFFLSALMQFVIADLEIIIKHQKMQEGLIEELIKILKK